MIEIDRIVRTRRRTIALIVQRDGALVVRAPLRATDEQILELVNQKAGWIKAKQEQALETFASIQPKKFIDGEKFWYLGQVYPLEIVNRGKAALILNGKFCLEQSARPHAEAIFRDWYREQARKILMERVTLYASQVSGKYQRLRITSARTRWGSCSARGTLSFPWRLVMAPLKVIDYVVVHELVHLEEKNHGKKFWAKVQAIMPDYRTQKAWLDENGHLLTISY